MTSGSLKLDARSSTPLFQVQPSGWPSIAQMKMGFRSRAAMACASSNEISHGMVFHEALGAGRTSLCRRSKSSRDNVPDVASNRMRKRLFKIGRMLAYVRRYASGEMAFGWWPSFLSLHRLGGTGTEIH